MSSIPSFPSASTVSSCGTAVVHPPHASAAPRDTTVPASSDGVDLSVPLNRPLVDERHWPAVAGAATLTTAALGFALGGPGGALGAVGLLAVGTAVAAAALASTIVAEGRRDHQRPSDCIIVLGTTPGPALTARTRHAEQLLRAGVAPAIILTGGKGTPGHTESDAAFSVARADGIPPTALYPEARSENTWQNFENAREIMRVHGWTTAVVSTDPFHQRRSIQMAQELGIDAVGSPAVESPRSALRDLVRECVSTVKYWNFRLRRELTPR